MGEQKKKKGPKKLRRSERRRAAMPIQVFGTTLKGRDFSEKCVCVKVSRHGAQIRLKHLLVADEIVYITNLKNNKEAAFRVVAQVTAPSDVPYSDWGVEAVDPRQKIWDA